MTRFRFPDSGDTLGAHLSTRGGLHTAFDRAEAVGANAVALFSKNSNQWRAKDLTEDDCGLFHQARRRANIAPVLTHTSYLINLATTNEEFYRKSLEAMVVELERARRIGAHAVVLHPGAHLGAGPRKGIDQIARSLDAIHEMLPGNQVTTLLETAAGQGSCVGCTFQELGEILKLVDDRARVGICFDTCHVFAAGYDLRTRSGYEDTIAELAERVGLENVGAFHINDSRRPLGSRVDRHQHIGEGEIGLDAFGFLLNDARFEGIPKLLETPKTDPIQSDVKNLKVLRSLIAGEDSTPRRPGRTLSRPVRAGTRTQRRASR